MDGITEPVILVLGHPIAGNPAQFALERAFASLELEWRVLSSDVTPENLRQAIAGAEVLGFRGMLLDESLIRSEEADDGTRHDCLSRDPESEAWQSEDALSAWLEKRITEKFNSFEKEPDSLLWIGPADPRFPAALRARESQSGIAWASPELISNADLIAVTEAVDMTDWPRAEEPTLVVDFATGGNHVDAIRELGYTVIDQLEMTVGRLLRCVECWTGQTVAADVLTEAIEEYLAV
ncbi:MAG: hypothetical protein AAFU85_07725 [Planctomycetota bacterium]